MSGTPIPDEAIEAAARTLTAAGYEVIPPADWTPPLRPGRHQPLNIWASSPSGEVHVAVALARTHADRLLGIVNNTAALQDLPERDPDDAQLVAELAVIRERWANRRATFQGQREYHDRVMSGVASVMANVYDRVIAELDNALTSQESG